MRALLSTVAGGPQTLELRDIPAPVIGARQALVRIAACGVNFPDILLIEDRYQIKAPRPFAPGLEFAGTVTEVAEDVTSVQPGDRVIAMEIWGGMAEQAAVQADRLLRIPDEMPFDDAAALLVTYGTTYHALKQRGRLAAGERMLILGAAGGVGVAAIQIGKAMGAHVTAAASTQQKVDFCLAQGADAGIVYPRGPLDREAQKAFSAQLKAQSGADGFDVIYDAVGGSYAEPALRSIAWAGRYLVIGFAAGEIPKLPLNLTLLKGCDVLGVWWGAWAERHPDLSAQNNAELFDLYRSGRIRPQICERFPLERGAEAIERLAQRKTLGKIVVTLE